MSHNVEASRSPAWGRHGSYEKRHDVEEVRRLSGHGRLETTQLYAQIRPAALKHAMEFYEAKALDLLSE